MMSLKNEPLLQEQKMPINTDPPKVVPEAPQARLWPYVFLAPPAGAALFAAGALFAKWLSGGL
jgi:hypothetical protein